ncbi:MAG: SBBP repeat-containing protein [Anaerolineales bacterium]|nr:SBBP repeat-containing protein [Anaerolineales bacterium]
MKAHKRVGYSLVLSLLMLTGVFIPLSNAASFPLSSPTPAGGQNSLLIIENRGQFSTAGRFMIPGNLGTIWLATDALWLTIQQGSQAAAARGSHGPAPAGASSEQAQEVPQVGVHLKFSFVGGNPNPEMVPENPQDTKVSYFSGADPSRWVADAPVWGSLRYRDIYPGVDLVLDAQAARLSGGGIPWRLEAAQTADLGKIRLRIEGASQVGFDGRELRLSTAVGELQIPGPAVQSSQAVQLDPDLVLDRDIDLVAEGIFELAAPLAWESEPQSPSSVENITDLLYGSFLGGGDLDNAWAIAVDSSGAAYVTGRTRSADFPLTPGAFDPTFGQFEAFAAKLNPAGDQLLFATFLGGGGEDIGWGVALEGGNPYIVGQTLSTDFPITGDAYDTSCGSEGTCDSGGLGPYSDAFLAVLNADGTDLIYSTYLGGKDVDRGNGIDVESGVAYLTGITDSSDFPGGGYLKYGDAFVAALDTAGNLNYSKILGGRADLDAGFDIAVHAGKAYVTGETSSWDFLPGSYVGGRDAFVARLNNTGGVEYKIILGGTYDDSGNAIIADSSGNAYLGGWTRSSNFPITAGALSYQGGSDAFAARLNSSLGLLYSSYLGGSGSDEAHGIGLDAAGGIYVGGFTSSSNFPATLDAYQYTPGGASDAFVARLDLASSYPYFITYASYLGGNADDQGYDLAIDPNKYMYLAGYTQSANFPATPGALDTSLGGSQDGFVAKLGIGPTPAIYIQKYTHGWDADGPPGPYLLVSSTVDWTYAVTNTGRIPLPSVSVSDNQGVVVSCPKTSLEVNEGMLCTATSTAVAGQYANIGTATGSPGGDLDDVYASDPSHYFGAAPAIVMQKVTNGLDDSQILAGASVTWTYTITNPGNVPLIELYVSDNDPDVIPLYVQGDANSDGALDLDETWVYRAESLAEVGPYENSATASGVFTDDLQNAFTAITSDPSSYFGAAPAIALNKTTNGEDGSQILEGALVTWAYAVANSGNVPLSNLVVSDSDPGVTPLYADGDVNSDGKLDLDESWVYTATSIAIQGGYTNTGSVSADYTDDHGNTSYPEASDSSSYLGAAPEIAITKTTNGIDSLQILVGDPITWTYTITNPGNVPLTNLIVSDSEPGVTPLYVQGDQDGDSALDPNETWVYRATGNAVEGDYTNSGSVSAGYVDDHGNIASPSASDSSSYFGIDLVIYLAKTTNGADSSQILEGAPITWTYTLSNPGNVPLANLVISDSDPGVTPQYTQGDLNSDGVLDLDETWVYSAAGTASAGLYENIGAVSGVYTDDIGNPFTAVISDASAYLGAAPAISITKTSNGMDGSQILEGAPVTWTYTLSNPGNVPLANLVISDSDPTVIPSYTHGDLNGDGSLDPEETWVYSATSAAIEGDYANTASISADYTDHHGNFIDLEASDSSSYFGAAPAIAIVKTTNGTQGAQILESTPVTWTYTITNPGNVPLANLLVSDSDPGVTPVYAHGDLNNNSLLDLDETWVYRATGVAVEGNYTNIGSASADYADQHGNTSNPSASAASSYFGAAPAIAISKTTNGVDGLQILVGAPITWTYTIANPGNVPLANLLVSDSDPDVTPAYARGDLNDDDLLDLGETWVYTATGTAIKDIYTNTGSVSAGYTDHFGNAYLAHASDHSSYFGADPAIAIQKQTNGFDADTGQGPYILVGDTVTWTYRITNTGNVALTNIWVNDDNGTPAIPSDDFVSCSGIDLGVDESQTCITNGTARIGLYENTGIVTATHALAGEISASNLSHYYGAAPAIDIQKYVNSQDADSLPGPLIQAGSLISYTYIFTNTGNVNLADVTITDDNGTPENPGDNIQVCDFPILAPDEAHTCQASEVAEPDQHTNQASARGTPPVGPDIVATDLGNYHGYNPDQVIGIQTFIKGVDADLPPGAYIMAGETVSVTYTVFNFTTVDLDNTAVIDDNGTPGNQADDILVCTIGNIQPISWTTCSQNIQILAGQHGRTGVASIVLGDIEILASDPGNYFGVTPGIEIEKYTNNENADLATGPIIMAGETVTWTYHITNTSNITLTNVMLSDDDPEIQLDCPPRTLGPGKSILCTANGTARPGQYVNLGRAKGAPPGGLSDFLATDASHYFGADPSIQIQKLVNDHDANDPPGIPIPVGDPVTWVYKIRNTGNIELQDITVTDDNGTPGDASDDFTVCELISLSPDELQTCTVTGVAILDQYVNVAHVSGYFRGYLSTATDLSYYTGELRRLYLPIIVRCLSS